MKGTEKQVKYANGIITIARESWMDLRDQVKIESLDRFDKAMDCFFYRMTSDDAGVIIANRMSYPENARHLKNNMNFFTKVNLQK